MTNIYDLLPDDVTKWSNYYVDLCNNIVYIYYNGTLIKKIKKNYEKNIFKNSIHTLINDKNYIVRCSDQSMSTIDTFRCFFWVKKAETVLTEYEVLQKLKNNYIYDLNRLIELFNKEIVEQYCSHDT